MQYEIIMKAVLTLVGLIVSGLFGYCVNVIKSYKNNDKTQEEALKCLLRSNITSKYYVYNSIGEIPQYEKANVNYMYEQYKKMGGNSYVSQIVDEINNLKVK